MASILDKLALFAKSNLHGLLDRAIDLNSVEACKQLVRDLEEAADGVKRTAAAARADVGLAKAALETTTHTIEDNAKNAELLLSDDDPSNDDAATALMEENVSLEATLADQQEAFDSAQKLATAVGTASEKLSAKKTEMLRNITRLQNLERGAKAKGAATDALEQVAALSSKAGAVSVDDVAARLKRESAVQDERLNEALAGVSGGSTAEAVSKAKANAKIAEMKAKLAAKKGVAASA